MLKVFEAFAGIGTQRMALKRLGINHSVVGICEIDRYAIETYRAIHGEVKNFGDISKVSASSLPDFDLFTYSFPCQDISVAGHRRGLNGGTRSGLLYECEKIIEIKKPKYLLLENVKSLVGGKFKGDFDNWLKYLEMLGYSNYWQVLNAKDYGIPQNRERVFVVSIRGSHDHYEFPRPCNQIKSVEDCIEDAVDNSLYTTKPFSIVTTASNDRYIHFDDDDRPPKKIVSNYAKTVRDSPTQNRYRFLGIGHHPWSKKFEFNGYRDDICPCLLATDYKAPKTILLESDSNTYSVRRLTPRECWRLTGIDDDDFDKAKTSGVSNTQLYKQAGNAIVVNVLAAIFKNLF